MTVLRDSPLTVAPHDLFARLAAALAAASRTDRHAIVIVDVDDLTAINRTHGTAAGDAVVDAVWRGVAGALEGDERVARWAGDQFVVFLPGAGRRAALRRARAIVDAVAAPAADGMPAVSVSAGVAASPAHGTTNATLIEAGADALYRAKRDGRGLVRAPGRSAAPRRQAVGRVAGGLQQRRARPR